MRNDERTFIGSAEIRFDNTTRRDALVAAAERAGFKVECSEAIGVSFSGATTPSYWYITVNVPGRLNQTEKAAERAKLASAWRGL